MFTLNILLPSGNLHQYCNMYIFCVLNQYMEHFAAKNIGIAIIINNYYLFPING